MHAIAPFLVASGAWQAWAQPILVLLSIAAAAAWLTARWLIRRRSGCTGDCSRCVAHAPNAGPCRTPSRPAHHPPHRPATGIRSPGLQVLQGPTNVPHSGDV
jgi:hypothetical protein